MVIDFILGAVVFVERAKSAGRIVNVTASLVVYIYEDALNMSMPFVKAVGHAL